MATDRELIALAAKAAGYDKIMESVGLCDAKGKWTEFVKRRYWDHSGNERKEFWSPLHDDGDALRLAVQLDCFPPRSAYLRIMKEQHPMAALRLAIVRAAAEMGEAM